MGCKLPKFKAYSFVRDARDLKDMPDKFSKLVYFNNFYLIFKFTQYNYFDV